MQKNDVLRCGESIVRVLDTRENQALIVTYPHKSVPLWINQEELSEYQTFKEKEIPSFPPEFEELSSDQRRIAHERYTLIAGILPFIGDERQRCTLIARISEEKGISKATLRRYLHQYLVYQRVSALAPKQKTPEKALSKDEKNMRWALNKFYYTRRKNSLTMAYTQMLKERYCDVAGNLIPGYPSIHQFKYFHKKHKSLQTYYIETLNEAYQKRLSLLHTYIEPVKKRASSSIKPKRIMKPIVKEPEQSSFSIAQLVSRAKEERTDIVALLKEQFPVEEVVV